MCEITIFANVEMPTFLTRKVQLLKASNSAYPKCSLFQLEKRRSFLVSSGMFTFHLENAWICKGRCCNQRSGTICSPIRRNVARRLRFVPERWLQHRFCKNVNFPIGKGMIPKEL